MYLVLNTSHKELFSGWHSIFSGSRRLTISKIILHGVSIKMSFVLFLLNASFSLLPFYTYKSLFHRWCLKMSFKTLFLKLSPSTKAKSKLAKTVKPKYFGIVKPNKKLKRSKKVPNEERSHQNYVRKHSNLPTYHPSLSSWLVGMKWQLTLLI